MDEAQATNEVAQDSKRLKQRSIQMRLVNAIMVLLTAAIVIIFMQVGQETNRAYSEFESASENFIMCESAASDMKAGSNYLTIQVRSFVVTQNAEYMKNYFWEVNDNQRRERALETFEALNAEDSSTLRAALDESNELMNLEYYAMLLVCDACGYDDLAEQYLSGVELTPEDAALSRDQKIALAESIVFGPEYMDYVSRIEGHVSETITSLETEIDTVRDESQASLEKQLIRQRVLSVLLFLVVIAMAVCVMVLILWPLRRFIKHIEDNEALPITGASEVRYMANAYNVMYAENMKSRDVLQRKAEHDHLTGLYNRSVFERILELRAGEDYAVMIVDADYFKEVNDTYGHDMGDSILRKIAGLLEHTFRTTDYPCRLGGDEFVVFMTGMTSDLKHVIEDKAKSLLAGMADTSDGLPPLTLSIGVAFSDGELTGEQVFKRADQALYKVKESGRNGFGFYSE